MDYAQKIVNNILGVKKPRVVVPSKHRNLTTKQYKKKYGPQGDIDGDGVKNWKDCRPLDRTRDLVHYGYYEGIRDDGGSDLVYAGSVAGVRRIAEDKKVNYVKIEEKTYAQAYKAVGEAGLAAARAKTAGYTSAGKTPIKTSTVPKAPQ